MDNQTNLTFEEEQSIENSTLCALSSHDNYSDTFGKLMLCQQKCHTEHHSCQTLSAISNKHTLPLQMV